MLAEGVIELSDLLRWRDAWGEPPTEHGEYLVQRLEFDGGYSRMVVYWNGGHFFLVVGFSFDDDSDSRFNREVGFT